MNEMFANFLRRRPRPVVIILAFCFLIFVIKSAELMSLERKATPAIAELNATHAGGLGNGDLKAFVREYMNDPFGKARGLSARQLELCQQLSAMVPAYESAVGWRRTAIWTWFLTLLLMAFKRWNPGSAGAGWNWRVPGSEGFRGMAGASDFRNIAKVLWRQLLIRAEGWALKLRQKIGLKGRNNEPSAVYSIIACPACPRKLRLPSGKGRVRITCPSCGTLFESVT